MGALINTYLLFIYRPDGFHTGFIRLDGEEELRKAFDKQIKDAIKQRLEVRITDTGDMMLFYSYNGCIKYDGLTHHECDNCNER